MAGVLLSAGCAFAQQGGAGAQAPAPAQGQGQAGAQAPAANKNPKPKSKAEADAINSLNQLVQNPATTGDQIDAAMVDFVTKYPTSDFIDIVNVWAMNYFQQHQDYLKVLQYGEAAIKANPNDLIALITVGADIPVKVHDTDLDKDQRLAEAESDNDAALALLSAPTVVYNGHALNAQQVQLWQASCDSALGRVALIRQQYTTAVASYQKAIQLDDDAHKPMDLYLCAKAQEGLKQYADAKASLDQAITLNTNPGITTLAKQEETSIAPQIGH